MSSCRVLFGGRLIGQLSVETGCGCDYGGGGQGLRMK